MAVANCSELGEGLCVNTFQFYEVKNTVEGNNQWRFLSASRVALPRTLPQHEPGPAQGFLLLRVSGFLESFDSNRHCMNRVRLIRTAYLLPPTLPLNSFAAANIRRVMSWPKVRSQAAGPTLVLQKHSFTSSLISNQSDTYDHPTFPVPNKLSG